jgi:hypothetical protein
LREHSAMLAHCSNTVELRALESRAAGLFWQALTAVPVQFLAADQARVPAFWRTVGRRSSAVTGSPRGASTPAHALWNFAYSCAAGEVGIALRSVGLDPGISPTGLHADTANRTGATWDTVEAIRGDVDRLILAMIQGRRFRRRDFVEQVDGRVRLIAPIARELAEAVVPVARQSVGPIAEELARTLARNAIGPRSHVPTLPTNLSGEARSRGRAGIRTGTRKHADTSERVARALIPPACRLCGLVLDSPGRTYCNECLPMVRQDQGEQVSIVARAKLAKLRAVGVDPSQTPEVKRKVGRANAQRMREVRAWDREHERPDPEVFVREILPHLQGIPLRKLAAATGLSVQHCGMIRRGVRMPHPKHWQALRDLFTDQLGGSGTKPDQSHESCQAARLGVHFIISVPNK